MLTLTPSARDKISELLSNLPQGGVRIAVVLGGCAGIRYALGLERTPTPGDAVLRDGNAAVFVDPDSAPSLKGTVVDFTANIGGGGFTFDNPNAIGRCTCGDPNAACGQ
ncbi:MAG: iron-sulfur cluster assembly accessory protein [Rhodospirillaceae bacterium]|nr:iron-sulfur cluster assembly accessory protein [Rhodospirillaceae bacterium]